MSNDKKVKTISQQQPLLYLYSIVLIVAELATFVIYVKNWQQHVQHYENLTNSVVTANIEAATTFIIVVTIIMYPLIYLLVGKELKHVKYVLKFFMVLFFLGVAVTFIRGSLYGVILAFVEFGFTYYMFRLVNEM